MTGKQKIEMRRSEVSQRLAELAAADGLDETRSKELDALTAEFATLEKQWRAAELSEQAHQVVQGGGPSGPVGQSTQPAAKGEIAHPMPTGHRDRELAELRSRVSLSKFVAAALDQRAVTGAEAEYAAAVIPGAEAGMIPLELLEERTVQTSNITGTGPADQSPGVWRPTLERVFQTPVTQMLGITQESVPMGQPVYPVVTDGGAPSMLAEAAEDTTPDDVTLTISSLEPRRLTAHMEFTGELQVQLPQIEEVMRRDMAASFRNEMERQVLVGDGTGVNVSGITHGIAAATNPSAATTYQEYSSLAAEAVDGIWANSVQDVRILMPIAAYTYGASLFQTTTTSESGLQMLMSQSAGIAASAHLPGTGSAGRSNTSDCYAIRNNGRTWAYMPVWSAFTTVRDPYSKATSGITRLISTAYWNFDVVRSQAIVALAVRSAV